MDRPTKVLILLIQFLSHSFRFLGAKTTGSSHCVPCRWSRHHAGLHQLDGARRHVQLLPHLDRPPAVGAPLVEEVHHTAADCK